MSMRYRDYLLYRDDRVYHTSYFIYVFNAGVLIIIFRLIGRLKIQIQRRKLVIRNIHKSIMLHYIFDVSKQTIFFFFFEIIFYLIGRFSMIYFDRDVPIYVNVSSTIYIYWQMYTGIYTIYVSSITRVCYGFNHYYY